MPPKTKAKPRFSAAPRPKAKAKPEPKPKSEGKRSPKVEPTSTRGSPSPPELLDKALVLRILLAKLEASKTCDWYELSLKLGAEAPEDTPTKGMKGGKGKKNAGTRDNARGLSGSDLHSLYHNKILPGLKAGRALWAEDDDGLTALSNTDRGGGGNSRPKVAKRHSNSSVEEVDEDMSDEEMDVEPEVKVVRPARNTVAKKLDPVDEKSEEEEEEEEDFGGDYDPDAENGMSDVEYDDPDNYVYSHRVRD